MMYSLFPNLGKPIYQVRESKARHNYLALQTPNPNPKIGDLTDRDSWIESTCRGFVSNSPANKRYYRVILECLWPVGHGIPGPIVSTTKIREAITKARMVASSNKIKKPYLDPFRRLRELQGEEGLVGIARYGSNYQLVDLTIREKRIPRTTLNDKGWEKVLVKYHGKCAVCRRSFEKFQQDHKIPRLRTDIQLQQKIDPRDPSNWQPLCDECNNFKSTCCRGCIMDCLACPWAFPEKNALVRIDPKSMEKLRKHASDEHIDPSVLLNSIIEKYVGNPPY